METDLTARQSCQGFAKPPSVACVTMNLLENVWRRVAVASVAVLAGTACAVLPANAAHASGPMQLVDFQAVAGWSAWWDFCEDFSTRERAIFFDLSDTICGVESPTRPRAEFYGWVTLRPTAAGHYDFNVCATGQVTNVRVFGRVEVATPSGGSSGQVIEYPAPAVGCMADAAHPKFLGYPIRKFRFHVKIQDPATNVWLDFASPWWAPEPV